MKKMHFMGIGGQGISAVAQMAQAAGDIVTGCDRQASATTRALEQVGIPVQIGHSSEHLAQIDTLVISPAVPALDPNNAELLAARAQGIEVVTWQEVLGELMRDKCVLSISGVHGKGTTTAMLSLMLVDAGLDPTCEIGAVVPRFGANYRLGKGQYFVNEADEFNHNFWHYHPRVALVTSIEYEHPEFFVDYNAFLDAFEHFVRGMDLQGAWPIAPTLILNANSPGCLDLRQRLIEDWPGRILTYATELTVGDVSGSWDAEPTFEAYAMQLAGETSFRVRAREGLPFPDERVIRLQLPGLYNIENALAALSIAHILGVDSEVIARTLEGFGGTRRRFEVRYQGSLRMGERQVEDVMLVDDYAHHPTAIALTLEGTRRRYPGRRLVAVYQPHMYSRTMTFFAQFLDAFDVADIVIMADIFPARERDTGLIHARELVAAIAQRPRFAQQGGQILHRGDVQATAQQLQNVLQTGDIAVIMGAGDIYMVTELLMQNAVEAPHTMAE